MPLVSSSLASTWTSSFAWRMSEQVRMASGLGRMVEEATRLQRDWMPVAAPVLHQAEQADGLLRLIEAASQPHRELNQRIATALRPSLTMVSPRITLPTPAIATFQFPAPSVLQAQTAHLRSFERLTSQFWNPHMEALTHLRRLLQPLPSSWDMISDLLKWLRYWGRRCYRAACAAMEAARHGDLKPIRCFIKTELGLAPTKDRIQALAAALLPSGWETGLDLDDEAAVRTFLRGRANQGNERIGDHTVRGQPIAYLPDGLDAWPTREPGPERQALERVERWDDWRLPLVLARLEDEERQVALTWAENHPMTWGQAALESGKDPKFGERVRLKLKRQGNVITARARSAT